MARTIVGQWDTQEEATSANTDRLSTYGAHKVETGSSGAGAPGPRLMKVAGTVSKLRAHLRTNTSSVTQTVNLREGATGATDLNPSIDFLSSDSNIEKIDSSSTDRYEVDERASVGIQSTGGSGSCSWLYFCSVFEADGDTTTLTGANSSGNLVFSSSTNTFLNPMGRRFANTTRAYARVQNTIEATWRYLSIHVDISSGRGAVCTSEVDGVDGNQSVTLTASTPLTIFTDTTGTDAVDTGEFFSLDLAVDSDAGQISIEKVTSVLINPRNESWVGVAGIREQISSGTTVYAGLMGDVIATTTQDLARVPVDFDCTWSHLGADVSEVSGSPSVTVTSQVNGVDGNQSVTLSGIDSGMDTTGTDELTEGDDVNTEWTSSGGTNYRMQSVVGRITDSNVGPPGGLVWHGGLAGHSGLAGFAGGVVG